MTAQLKLPLPLLLPDVSLALQSLTSRMRTLPKGPQQLVCIYVCNWYHVRPCHRKQQLQQQAFLLL